MDVMCGRVIQSSGPFNLAIVHGMNVHDSRAFAAIAQNLRRLAKLTARAPPGRMSACVS
jgi:hypothetical protein